MDEFYNKNADDEKMRRKRRSSILKTPKNRDPFSEIEPPVDITLSKSVRRVSFASSNFVKPFVADPIKNTIWDTTYEEEVNHTNSTQSSQEQMSTKLNSTFLHSIHTSSNITNFETSEMDITKLIRDKENILQISPVMSLVDYAKQRQQSVPLYDITQNSIKMNGTQTEAPTMEFTCQYFTPQLQETEPEEDVSSEMELTEISLSEESEQSITSKTEQTLHCDSENIILSKSDNIYSIPSTKTDNISIMAMSKARHDMELTYQNPDFDKTLFGHSQMSKRDTSQKPSIHDFNEDQITCMPKTHSKVGNELICQIPTDAALGAAKSMNDMDLTRQIPEKLSKTLTSDLEFTCQIPADTVLQTDKSMRDMELTRQIPEKLSKSRTLSKGLTLDMEFTCQKPANTVLWTDKSMSDMDLTRQIPEKLSKSRKLSKTLTADMEFTCQIPADAALQVDKSMNDMDLTRQIPELTRRIPEKLSKPRKVSKTLTADMEFTCQIPADAALQADKSLNDMEFTCQIPEKLSKSRKLSNTEKTLTSDMEFTCQIQNKSETRMELTCQIPTDKTVHVDKSWNDMEFTCHISDNQSNTRKSFAPDMEFTCQYLAPFLQKNERAGVSEMELTEISLSPETEKSEQAITSKTEQYPHHDADKENLGVETCQMPLPKTLHDTEHMAQISDLDKTSFGFCQVPKINCQILSTARQDFDKGKDHTPLKGDMELTCHLSDKTLEVAKSMNDMEFTRQIPGSLSTSRKLSTSDIENTCQIPKTETVDNIKSSCQIPLNDDLSQTKTSSASDTNMTLTCQVPLNNELSTVENLDIISEMSKVHSLSKTNTKIGCQVPEEYSLTNIENSRQIRENSEVSCQIPNTCMLPKVEKEHEISCHDMNKTEYMEISYGDVEMTETKSINLGSQIFQEQGLSKTENMDVNQTEMSMGNIIYEIDKTKTFEKITNVSKIPIEVSPQDSKDKLKILESLDRKRVNQSDNDKVEGTPRAERTFVKKQIPQTTPKSPFNTSKIPVRSPGWMKSGTPSKKTGYLSVNKEESQLESTCANPLKTECDVKNDILFSQKIPNLTSDKNSFYLFKTPEASFRIHSPNITSGVDDTQLLLHCTYNKSYPNSLLTPKIENEVSCYNSFSLKETENISKPNLSNISNINLSDADGVLRNVSRSSSDTSSIDFLPNKLTTVNDTYVLKGKKIDKHVSYVDDFVIDENIELNNESMIFPLIDELPPIQKNYFEVKLQEFYVEIGNKLASNNLAERIGRQRIKTIDLMKRFKFKPIHIPKELTLTEKRSEGELPIKKSRGNENEPSIEDKVKEHQIRCQNSWKLEKIDGDIYHFSTLSDAVVFTTQIDPSDGKVHSLEITNKLTDSAHPIYRYAVKQFLSKLEDNHVKAAIGKQLDLLSLLDYVQMVRTQLTPLLKDLIKCDLTIERDCMACFSFFNEILGLYFVVSVDVTDLENIDYNSVEITRKIGTVNENELKNYLKNGPKGWNFFKEFSQAIKDFLTIKEKRKRF